MKVFFDQCTAPRMAHTLHGFIRSDGHTAVHLSDILPRSTSDIDWINHLRDSQDEWLVVTADKRIRRNRPEREAFRRAGLRAFVLANGFEKQPMHRRCAALVNRWPDMSDQFDKLEPPFMFEPPVAWGARLKQLPF